MKGLPEASGWGHPCVTWLSCPGRAGMELQTQMWQGWEPVKRGQALVLWCQGTRMLKSDTESEARIQGQGRKSFGTAGKSWQTTVARM